MRAVVIFLPVKVGTLNEVILIPNVLIYFVDIDECIEGLDIACGFYAECVNAVGSYLCVCSNGYLGNGTDCCKLQ